MASVSKRVTGRPLRSQAREIVYSVAQFLKKKQFDMDINIGAVTSEATGVSERLVSTVCKEGKESLKKRGIIFFYAQRKKGP